MAVDHEVLGLCASSIKPRAPHVHLTLEQAHFLVLGSVLEASDSKCSHLSTACLEGSRICTDTAAIYPRSSRNY